MSGNTKPHIKADALRGFKYLNDLLPMLQRYHSVGQHHNRKLHFDQYLTLIILYFFNPVLTSLRAIQQATTIEAVQKKLGVEMSLMLNFSSRYSKSWLNRLCLLKEIPASKNCNKLSLR